MPEKGPHDHLSEIKAELQYLRIQAKLKMRSIIVDLKHRFIAKKDEYKDSKDLNTKFIGEVLDFLKSNLTASLQPLRLNQEQTHMFQLLMSYAMDKELKLEDESRRVDDLNRPFVASVYKAGEQQGDYIQEKSITLVSKVGLETVPTMAVFGHLNRKEVKGVKFLALPAKAELAEPLYGQLGIPKTSNDNLTNTIGVYDKGNRIIINREGIHNGRSITINDQYVLIGAFEGEETKKTYWLYGSNQDYQNKVSVSQPTKNSQTAMGTFTS